MQYKVEPLAQVNNRTCRFMKLVDENGKCQFDEFLEEISSNVLDVKSMDAILSLMDVFSFDLKLPEKKFRQIEWNKRKDVFEFKKNNIRVYVLLQRPDVFVIMGGYKKRQDKDIRIIKNNIIDFRIE